MNTATIEEVFQEVRALKPEAQEDILQLIKDELAWTVSLNKPSRKLFTLANEALEEDNAGKTKPCE